MTLERDAQLERIVQLAAAYIESVDIEVRRLFPSDAPGRSDNRELAALRKALAELPER